jgi:hypothetical protein
VSFVLPQVLTRVMADKKFISTLAKKAVTACAEHVITPATAACLVEAVNAKSLDLAEFATCSLQTFASKADPAYFDQNYESGLEIVAVLCDVIEGKKTRMVKFA